MTHVTVPDPARHIATTSARTAGLLAELDPSAPVPTCPGWTAHDLLAHVVQVHRFWAEILAGGDLGGPEVGAVEEANPVMPTGPGHTEALLTARADATAALLEQLAARSDEEPAWSWFAADRSVGFTRRMQVHEATVHGVDAELAAGVGTLTPIEGGLAADGLDHLVHVMWTAGGDWLPDDTVRTPAAVLALRPTDAPALDVVIDRWASAGEGSSGLAVTVGSGDGSLPRAEVTGPARALYLWGWGRGAALDRLPDGGPIGPTGDPEAVALVTALLEQGID